MLSNFLIHDKFEEFNNLYQKQRQESPEKTQITKKINYYYLNTNHQDNLIEQVDDKSYNLYEQEVIYKIFEDISSVSKINGMIELVLEIPSENNIISINKIKLSNKLNNYIKDIYVKIDNEKIITKDDFKKEKFNTSKILENVYSEKIINCQNKKNINLHILFDNQIINKIINKNIVVNYSYAIFKNKVKFI
jgi:hypothetical protein